MKEGREQRKEMKEEQRGTSTEANAVVKEEERQIEKRHSRSRRWMEKIRNYTFMNGLKSIRRLFKKNREKISRREELILV